MSKIKFYMSCVRWLYMHRHESDCRQKFRRMEREVLRS